MKKKIFFVMPNLGGGGGERIVSILLNNIDRELYQPNLIIIKNSGSNEFINTLKSDVELHYLNIKTRIRVSFFYVIIKLLAFCQNHNPDVLFFGSGQINVILSPFLFLFPKKIKLIARESNIPTQFEKNYVVKLLYRLTYKNFNKIIVQSDDMFNDLHINFSLPKKKLIKINNPVDFEYIQNLKDECIEQTFSIDSINLLATGRLTYQKGFDMLITAVSKLEIDNFKLFILGEGEEKENLSALIDKLDLSNKIILMGNVKNPYKYFAKADGFILSSRFEGFPNVVLESLSCGTPVLANNCLGGINEIIKPSFNGYIYDFSNDNFEEKLMQLITTDFNKVKIIEDTKARFSVSHKIIEFQKAIEL